MSKEYRLTFECINPHTASALEAQYGPNYWKRISDISKKAFSWASTEVVFQEGNESRIAQYKKLKEWEESGEQPIRNVTLEVREPNTWSICK